MAEQIEATPEVSQVGTTQADLGQGGAPPQSTLGADKAEYFFEAQFDGDKEPTRWKSKEELARYLREGTLRHADYTKKRQADSEAKKAFDKQKTDYEQQMKDFMGLKTRYDQIDQFLRQRPDVQERIVREMRGTSPPAQKNEIEEKVMKEVQAIKEELERRDREKQNEEYRNRVFEKMGSKYQDFNKDEIMELMQEVEGFQSLPPENAMESFAELLYHARKGRQNPAQIEERIVNNLQKKAQATTPMPGGLNGRGTKGVIEGSIDDVHAQLKRGLR